MADGHLTALCSFDITKCFDTINHSILLKKMEYYGLQSENIKWFKKSLNEREQKVSCHNTLSGKSTRYKSACSFRSVIRWYIVAEAPSQN